ncbi:hypothetical protein RJ639_031116 [Escallonia herrerae]|uniref:Pentatricopeptide repeat-containing protein n=1 Tax=Escallonia herrerae TaxID=1293975 RepID=A0AA88XFM4_9ASTE|nr:hypothetical protein RJ639_031116 [Escallonia herrerae]
MNFQRILLRSLRKFSALSTTATTTGQTLSHHQQPPDPIHRLIALRNFAYSSAEEAAAERRRLKRRLLVEPPLYALRRDANTPRPDPRLPETTSALVGPRLNLHNRVQSLIRAGDLDTAADVAHQSIFSRPKPTVFTFNAIAASMYRAKRYSDSIAFFDYYFNRCGFVPNLVSYNNLILTHCESGNVDKGVEVYNHILANAPFTPSYMTYRHLTKGLVDAGRIDEAVYYLREMLNKALGADSIVYDNLIRGYLNLDNLEKAYEFFDELRERCQVYDGAVHATFMDWFFSKGREKDAMDSYKSLLDKGFRMVPPTCNVLLETLLKHGKKVEAEALFDHMLGDHTPPTFNALNSDTFNIMVNECFRLGKVSEAYEVFRKVGKSPKCKPFSMDLGGYSNMIARYCELEMMDEATQMFAELWGKSLSPNITTYRTLIDAYFKMERIDDALQTYKKMVGAGLRVIPPYANKWFSKLIEKGMVLDCAAILSKMYERDPKPDTMSYDMVIRGLCQEGNLDTTLTLLEQMLRGGVGVTPTLREYLPEVFGKEGRLVEIEELLNASFISSAALGRSAEIEELLNARFISSAAQGQSSGPPRMGGQVAPPYVPQSGPPRMSAAPQTQTSELPRMAKQSPSQMGGQMQPSEPPQMAGQFAAPYMQPSELSRMGGQLQPPPRSGGQMLPSGPPQMGEQVAAMHMQPSELSRMAGQVQPSWAPRMEGREPTAQMQSSFASRMDGQVPSVQMHPSATPQMAGSISAAEVQRSGPPHVGRW